MAKDTGGNAFPTTAVYESEKGMTLRDYFAAKSMQAMIASPNCPMSANDDAIAEQSYAMADAMLKARNA